MVGLRVRYLSLFFMGDIFQPERHIWQQRSIRISIGRRLRRVREWGACLTHCLTQIRQVQKKVSKH